MILSLLPKPVVSAQTANNLKRKLLVFLLSMYMRLLTPHVSCSNDTSSSSSQPAPAAHKKKKGAIAKHAANAPLDPNDHAALNRRAMRFQREHEIERQKAMGRKQPAAALRSPSYFGDDPEAEPVRLFSFQRDV